MKNYLISFILGAFLTQIAIGQAIWQQYQGPFVGGVASYATKSDTIFIGTPMGVYSSTDKGNTWTVTGLKESWHNAILTNNNLLISQLGYSQDNGKNWSSYLNGWHEGFRALYSFKGIVYAGTDNGVFKFNSDDKSWASKNSGIKGEEFWQKDSIITSFTSIGNILFCGTFNKGMFFSRDSGETWNKSSVISSGNVKKLLNYKDTLFAIANGIFLSADSGQNWINIQYNLATSNMSDIAVLNDTIILSTLNGIFKFNKSNLIWKSFNNESFETLFVTDNILFASNSYGLYRWNNQNSLFELSNNGINTARILDMALFSNILYCTTEVGTFYTADNGKSWNGVAEAKNQFCYAIAQNDTMLFIGTGGNGIISSSIHSNIWHSLNNGLTSEVIWDIEANGNTLFAATDSGPFISKNSGKNWIPITKGFQHSSSQYGTSPKQALSIVSGNGMVLASNLSGLYKLSKDSTKWDLVGFSEDGGKMVKIIDNTVYFGKELGGLYKSIDSCKTWIPLYIDSNNPVIFDMFKRGNNNLYASSTLHIYYSSDEGKHWDNWSETGMPNLFIYRVIQGDSFLYAGTYGRSVFKREYLKLTDCRSSYFDISGSAITNIPINTPSDTLISKLILAHGASSVIVQKIPAKAGQIIVKSGDIVKVIAEDSKTSKNYTIQVITGINELSESDIEIYPTLTHDKIFFSHPNEIKSIVIYNIQGQIILKQKYESNSINVGNLKAGTYLLSIIKIDSRKINVKFIKQ
jgi:hypothetical protein